VYVRLGSSPFDYATFIEALRQGKTFSTNGPIVELDVDGRYRPGDRIGLEPRHEYRVRARARSRDVLERLQLVANGSVVAEQTGGQDSRELWLEKALRFDRSAWVAVRAFERTAAREAWQPGPQVFAHSSPVHLILDGAPVIVPESVRDLVQKIDLLIAHTERLDGFTRERDRQETLDLYRSARELLSRRAPESGAPGASGAGQ
jgi:hypothetical protein